MRESEPGKDRIALVLEGKAQYGVGGPALLNLRAQGKPVVVLAQIFQYSPAMLITLRESGIFSPDELVGKKVMLSQDAIGSAPIKAMLLETLGDLAGLNKGNTSFPSLVLSSHSFKEIDESRGIANNDIIVMLIPLRLKRDFHEFMRELARTIKIGNPFTVFKEKPESKWAWLADYLELKPNFFGLGVDLNPIFSKIFGAKA